MTRKTDPYIRFKKYFFIEIKTGCWIWTGSSDRYGTFFDGDSYVKAHRWSYEYHKGPIGNLCVCHTCDTPSCVNPDHLWLGIQNDNMKDMKSKGRAKPSGLPIHPSIGKKQNVGESNASAKLKEADIRFIRNSDLSNKELAKIFKVNKGRIWAIKTYKTWKHVS